MLTKLARGLAAPIADTGKAAYTVPYDPYGGDAISADGRGVRSSSRTPTVTRVDSARATPTPDSPSSATGDGLTKFGYRWQSSVTGGRIERDTLDAPLSPSNANRYGYAGLDPINSSDSTGRCASIPGNGVCTGGTGAYDASEALPWAAYTCAAVDLYALAASAIPPLPVVAAPNAITCGVISVAGAIANPTWA